MQKTELKKLNEYVKAQQFSLKNKVETEQKHKDYKSIEFDNFLKDNKEEITEHFNNLNKLIIYEINKNMFYSELKLNSKSSIRILKTYINGITFDLNQKFMSDIDSSFNNNTKRIFAIKLYLKFYNEINSIMKMVLIELFKLKNKEVEE